MRESNPLGVGGSHEPSQSAKPAHDRPELLNNSGGWFRGVRVRAGPAWSVPRRAPGARAGQVAKLSSVGQKPAIPDSWDSR
jgi:hypothetical protein